ncbi:AI-2E family transporter [Streptococcus cuniculipharyngis]|uniref:AI-2E family transporter n=1 Tax=Streptococcus cuniculipharyngis TaxID=1562651 RepID=A0A5C5SFY4_9STRE|nr:AI-2E family transporter [Streptococcus cuniculipharyngis]TWS99202.1 AI-2E family transporter [Streptococcus cuniculipharyngis]
MNTKEKHFNLTWFFKWFLNNQAVTVLLVTLLLFLNILIFTKISSLFTPLIYFGAVVMLPLVMSMILYYLLEPSVSWLEKKGLGRVGAISIVFFAVFLVLLLILANFVPMAEHQMTSFIRNLPTYMRSVEKRIILLLQDERLAGFRPQLESLVDNLSQKAVDYAETFSRDAVNWLGNLAGTLAKVAVAIIITPFILFYFLRDGKEMKTSFLSYIPTRMRASIRRILSGINAQLSGYVQGQVTVAIVVGIMFSIMFSLIGLPYAITFGVLAGVLNMIPYLGSFLAMVPVVILGLVGGPFLLIKVLLVFMIEQTIEGRFVTPLVLGSKLSIHPITIMFILLTTGSMFGVWGVFLGIPIYASIKVVVKEIFAWYRQVSGLYEEDVIEHVE